MNPLCLMECNLKSSMQWEWDNIISFSASTTENPRKPRLLEWEIDGLDSVSICSSGFAGGGSGGLGSDMGHAFSRSSKSTSISSSSIDMKTYNFTSEAGEALPEELCSSEELAKGIGTSPSLEASFGSSGEPILGLKLGKRTYFEDVCAGTNVKGLKLPVSLTSSASPVKRSKSISQSFQAPRCQVEGCNLDLSSAKHYHRKHRVCDSHSKCPIVVVGGLERRFCQQCSRFHGLNEFDEKKRSCRRRLTDHNARRRKPQPEPMQLNPGLTYDGKQHTNLVWNKFALIDTRREDKFLWEPIPSSKSMTLRELVAKPSKAENFDNNLLSSSTMQHGGSRFLPRKTKITTADLFSKDIEEVTMSSHLGGGSQDLDGALSLLSNATSWVSFESRCGSMDHHLVSNLETETNHAVTHQLNSSFENWQTDVQVLEPTTSNRDSGSQFQLLRGHYNESYFCPNQFN